MLNCCCSCLGFLHHHFFSDLQYLQRFIIVEVEKMQIPFCVNCSIRNGINGF